MEVFTSCWKLEMSPESTVLNWMVGSPIIRRVVTSPSPLALSSLLIHRTGRLSFNYTNPLTCNELLDGKDQKGVIANQQTYNYLLQSSQYIQQSVINHNPPSSTRINPESTQQLFPWLPIQSPAGRPNDQTPAIRRDKHVAYFSPHGWFTSLKPWKTTHRTGSWNCGWIRIFQFQIPPKHIPRSSKSTNHLGIAIFTHTPTRWTPRWRHNPPRRTLV